MTTYQYRCDTDGPLDVDLPIGTAPARYPCPACGREAPRSYTAPLLSLGSRRVIAAIDRTEKSRDEPELVSSVPSTGRRRRTPLASNNPALRRLPRP